MRKSIIRQVLTATLLLGVAPFALYAQACPDAAQISAGMSGPLATVRYLADDALEGRLAGSPGERCAGDFIARRFESLGLKPIGEMGGYFQTFALASIVNPHAPGGNGRNVIALLEGSDPALKNEYIIVGAHYDHLGMGAFGSTSGSKTPAIHNGADDNASGVAAMLDVAERLSKGKRPARSVLFMAFSGEESGLLGSAYFTANPTLPLAQARAMLNMDMVGRLGKGPLVVYGIGTAQEWKSIVESAAGQRTIGVQLLNDGTGPSDHTSFYMKDIPVLHFFTNAHHDYHNSTDDWDKIDATGLGNIALLVTDITQRLANEKNPVTLVKGAGKPPAPAGAPSGRPRPSLGTIPDFAPVPSGVKLSGVTAGSPADVAGIKAGDILIRFDNDEIKNLQDFQNALMARSPGDAVNITVLRDGKELTVRATLGRR